jgi:hypothetical protein
MTTPVLLRCAAGTELQEPVQQTSFKLRGRLTVAIAEEDVMEGAAQA